MIRFAALEWLIFVPLLLLAGWRWRRLELWRWPRVVLLTLLVLVLIQPQIRWLGRGLDLWVLVDRSASAADSVAANAAEWQTLLERSKSGDDRIIYVDYSAVPVVRAEGTGSFSEDAQNTRTGLAIQHALSHMARDRAARLLVFTDGYSTEPLTGVGERLARQQVSLDYRLVVPPRADDYGIADLRVPPRAQPGEPFLIEFEVEGGPELETPFQIRRNGTLLFSGKVQLQAGKGSARFTDRVSTGGAHRYEVRLTPERDSRSGNNAAEAWVEVTAGPRVVLITQYENDPAAAALRAQGFRVDVVSSPSTLAIGQLSGAKAVVLNNVPAWHLPPDFLASLDLFVRVQGGGLLMCGGKQSFASGGYFESPIDELLPVSMELRTEHRKLAVAMAIVMDRSGSMAASVASGMSKMDLANAGAARAVELLGPQDGVSVMAVDSEPHVFVPMTQIGPNREKIISNVKRIVSQGGGIFVYNGLKAGWAELQKSQAGQRHLVLFSDAADSEQPDDYKKLIAEMVKGGATISVIGLGTEQDSDAEFLKDIAARGKGRIFFNADANTLPGIFAQETVAVARSSFIDEPVKVSPTAGWLELAAKPLDWLDAVDGYNLSYLRPEATAAALSSDEYKAPLLAFWQRGAGRAASVSFPIGGDFSQRVRDWNGYGDFLQTLTRWLMGDELPPGLGLRTRVNGAMLELDLLYDESWEEELSRNPPRVLLASGASGEARSLVWQRLEPGHFSAAAPLQPGQWVRGAVQAGRHAVAFGPVIAGTNPEWRADRERLAELQTVARLSGGGERIDLSTIWQAPRREEFRDVRTWLLVVLLGIFLLDTLLTRLGWKMPAVSFARPRPKIAASPKKPAPAAPPTVAAEKPPPSPPPASPAAPDPAAARRARFNRAKRR